MELAKRIGNDIAWAALRLSETFTRTRGTDFAVGLGRPLGALAWALVGSRRRRCLDNARIVFPELSEPERRRIARESVLNSTSSWPELMSYCYFGRLRILDNVVCEGREHLDAALARGRGVIAPGIHMGNFPLIGVWMTAAGYQFDFVMRYPHDERVSRRLNHVGRVLEIGLIRDRPRLVCLRGCLGSLSRGGTLFLHLDMRAGTTGGIEVPFFGRPYQAFAGPISLALKTRATVLPMYIVRDRGIRHRLVIEPRFRLERTGDKRTDIRTNLARLMRRFEGWVREHPEQWWWFHRLWRAGSETRAD